MPPEYATPEYSSMMKCATTPDAPIAMNAHAHASPLPLRIASGSARYVAPMIECVIQPSVSRWTTANIGGWKKNPEIDDGSVAAAEFIFANLSTRLSERLRGDLAELEAPSKKASDAARAVVVTAITQARDLGEITLIDSE